MINQFLFTVMLWTLFFPLCLRGDNITVIGVGRLGICCALCLEQAGHHVLGVDISQDYVNQINDKTLNSPEPFVSEYLKKSKNFRATTSLEEGLDFSNLCFIVVATNSERGVNDYRFRILTDLFQRINALKVQNKDFVITSTLFPGYIRDTVLPLLNNCQNVTVSYNPEFIAQGAIIQGLQSPDVVLIGEGSVKIGDRLEALYASMCQNTPQISRMSADSAEIAKLALNCYITSKIAFANLVADIADNTPNADKEAILKCIGSDSRVGLKCLKPGYGFGGPCFPRDNQALSVYAEKVGIEPILFRATDRTNQLHAEIQASNFLKLNLDEYIFEDVCYKPWCPVPIIECSQKLVVAQLIAAQGKSVTIVDRPEVIAQVKKEFGTLFNYQEINSPIPML